MLEMRSGGSNTKNKVISCSDDEKRQRRLASNRRSAHKSRFRKAILLDELLKQEQEMRSKNETLRLENEQVRTILSIVKAQEYGQHAQPQLASFVTPSDNSIDSFISTMATIPPNPGSCNTNQQSTVSGKDNIMMKMPVKAIPNMMNVKKID